MVLKCKYGVLRIFSACSFFPVGIGVSAPAEFPMIFGDIRILDIASVGYIFSCGNIDIVHIVTNANI